MHFHDMPALTFKDLSTELTQAIEAQLDTPKGTKARCTLGREKVMVLVEYPSQDDRADQAEPPASSTLDWLEQSLRMQFDTVGLPEEAADLTEASDAVSVQLFLKHHSEPKPFTARSFVWKVADGLDDLFGNDETSDRPPVFQDETGSLSSLETNTEVSADSSAPKEDTPSVEESALIEDVDIQAITEPDSRLENDKLPQTELADRVETTFLSLSAIDNLESEDFSLPGEAPNIDLTAADLDLPSVELPRSLTETSELSDSGFFDLESTAISTPSTATDSELAADFESALDSSSADINDYETNEDIELSEDIFDELLAPHATALEKTEEAEEALENASTNYIRQEQLQPSDIETWRSLSATTSALSQTAVQPKAETQAANLSEETQTLPNADFLEEGTEPKKDIFEDTAEADAPKEADFEVDALEENNPVADINEEDWQSAADAEVELDTHVVEEYEESEEYESDIDSEYENDTVKESTLSPDEHYQLEPTNLSESDESVALVDEREVQQQREQWQQQTKSNPWFIVGAVGFFVAGLLGFIFTRPCSIGACPRIETAQAQGERALSDLTLTADLQAVTAAKKQLNRSVRSLQPIPFWSPHHSKAQAVLPTFESQLFALDRVSIAQGQAWEAALASQDAPHPSETWEEIAGLWRDAIATLETIPPENDVRRLADRKLAEYRANLSTIKVRIDAEASAEARLREAQQAATLATATAQQASTLEDWETALENWELAIEQIDQIPQGTLPYSEAQALQPDYREQMEVVRDRTLQERNASRNLSRAKQLASDAQRVAIEDQWTIAVQTWTAALSQVRDIQPGTSAHTEAQPLTAQYQQSLEKAENNRQVSQRFQPVEPSFYAACGTTATQKCTYSVSSGNVRLNLLQDYDRAINQSITPPDQRNEIDVDSNVVTQSNQLLKEITLLSTQAQVPIELYDAEGEFLARYRPDLNGFVRDRET